jgi:hypothetical protein
MTFTIMIKHKRKHIGLQKNTIMKIWIVVIISFFVTACKLPAAAQSVTSSKAIKKQEKSDIDSLFIVYSLPINVSCNNNFIQRDIADSLIALLKRKKYKYLDSSAYAQLFKVKLEELTGIGTGDVEKMKGFVAKSQSDKNYYVNKIQSADPFAQQIQLSFLKKDSGINYINVRRSNMPNTKKFRDWFFTYPALESSNQFVDRILDSLINTKGIKQFQ